METILMVIFTVIIVDASVREKPIQDLRTLATAGLIREYQLEDRNAVLPYGGSYSIFGLMKVVVDEGNKVQDHKNSDLEDCKVFCNNNINCKSFAYCPKYKNCHLRNLELYGNEATKDNAHCTTYFKPHVCSVNDAVGDGRMRGTCPYGHVCNADGTCVKCATRHTSKPCYDSKLRNTCLTTTDSRSGFTECGWCPKGSCTTPGSAQCEPVNWLRQKGVTEFDTCLDPEATCARRHNTAPCYEINDRISCLSTTDSRSDFFECGWCPDGPCKSPGSAQCEPVNWLREQGLNKFDTCLEPEDACENVRDNSGVKTCDYQLNKGGSSCIDYLKWGDCDFNCKLCPCSTSTGTSPQHCNGHGTCEATTCTKSTCTGVKCKCDPGWSGSKCEVCSVNDAVGDGSMQGTCPSGEVCNADGTCVVEETCQDGIRNQDEIDIDCGGACSACKPFPYYSDLGEGNCVDSDNLQPFYCWAEEGQKAKCEERCTSTDQCVAYEHGASDWNIYFGNSVFCQLIYLTKTNCAWDNFGFSAHNPTMGYSAGDGGNSVSQAFTSLESTVGRCYKKGYVCYHDSDCKAGTPCSKENAYEVSGVCKAEWIKRSLVADEGEGLRNKAMKLLGNGPSRARTPEKPWIPEKRGKTLEQCKIWCDETDGCNSIAWKSQGDCHLKEKCLTEDEPGLDSEFNSYYKPCKA